MLFDFPACYNEICNKENVHEYAEELCIARLRPGSEIPVGPAEPDDGTDHAHERATGDKPAGNESAFFAAFLRKFFSFFAVLFTLAPYEPGDSATDEEGEVEVQRDEHAERKRQDRHTEEIENEREYRP